MILYMPGTHDCRFSLHVASADTSGKWNRFNWHCIYCQLCGTSRVTAARLSA